MNLTRHDTEIALFGLALGSSITFASLRTGQPFGEAAVGGAAVATGAAAMIYGVSILTRSLPTAAARVIEFRQLVRVPSLAAEVANDQNDFGPVITEEPPDLEHRWRVALRQFLMAGRLVGGLALRTMVGSGIVTDPGYRKLAEALKDNGILIASKAGTDYAPTWDYGRACFHLKHEPLIVPQGEPPQLKF